MGSTWRKALELDGANAKSTANSVVRVRRGARVVWLNPCYLKPMERNSAGTKHRRARDGSP